MTAVRHVAALVAGVVAGLAAVLVHRDAFPAGLLLVLAQSLATAVVLVRSSRPGTGASYALGWLLLFGFVSAGRPEGDFAVASDRPGYSLIGIALGHVVLLLVAVIVARDRPT